MKIGIYKITNPNNKTYIGQSLNIDLRWKDYNYLRCKGQPKLHNSLKKYGYENHKFEILEECTSDQLNERETYYKQLELNKVNGNWKKVLFCELYDQGGGPRSILTKLKISNTTKGKPKNISKQSRISKIEKLKGNINKKGAKLTKKSCEKISIAKKGHKMFTNEWKDKISKSMKGKPLSEEHKQKLRKPKQTNESRNKISLGNKDKRNIPIIQKDLKGNVIKEWKSGKEASIILNIQKSNINNAIHGRLKTYKGFIWKIKNANS